MRATLGAATALGGFTLVFLGVVMGRYDELVPGASHRVRGRFVGPAGGLFLTFLFSLTTVAIGFAWLAVHGGHCFYIVVIVLFSAQLLATALASGYLTLGVLLKK